MNSCSWLNGDYYTGYDVDAWRHPQSFGDSVFTPDQMRLLWLIRDFGQDMTPLKIIAGLSMVSLINSFFSVHYWGAFCTVVLLGVIQILLAYYNSHITIEGLPESVSMAKRLRYRRVFVSLVLGITLLTLLLARLNDSNQYKADLLLEQERTKQEALQNKLDETLRAINQSQEQLGAIRAAIMTHPPNDPGRNYMLQSIDQVQDRLARQAAGMPGTGNQGQRSIDPASTDRPGKTTR